MIGDSLNRLKSYIEKEEYRGFDPYDALKSPLFKLPFFRSNKLVRFGTQQFVKRMPFNIRPILFIPKGYNPVSLGLSIQGYSHLYKSDPGNGEQYLQKIDHLIKELIKLIPEGFSGACWGYDFDWEARYARIPAYQPTVVATGIISNALFIAHQITGNQQSAQLVESSAEFVVKDLKRSNKEKEFCFSYSPFDRQQVFNASMKAVRILAQAHSLNLNKEYAELAKSALDFVVSHQNENGSWAYSLAPGGGWSDNYHTAYVLDCFDEYQKLTGDFQYNRNLTIAYKFYKNHFITDSGIPKFYHDKTYPVDCTSAAQTILTAFW